MAKMRNGEMISFTILLQYLDRYSNYHSAFCLADIMHVPDRFDIRLIHDGYFAFVFASCKFKFEDSDD